MKTKNRTFRAFVFLGILGSAIITIGGLLGLPVFPSNVDNSKKPLIEGCYFLGNALVARVYLDRIEFDQGASRYSVISDKMGLALLPTDLLRMERSGSKWKVIKVPGAAELTPYVRTRSGGLNFLTPDGTKVTVSKGNCGGLR
jgi:hypothetical protein